MKTFFRILRSTLKEIFSTPSWTISFLLLCVILVPLFCYSIYGIFTGFSPKPIIANSNAYAITRVQYNAGTNTLYDVTAQTDLEQVKEIISQYQCKQKHWRNRHYRWGESTDRNFEEDNPSTLENFHFLKIDGTFLDKKTVRTFRIILTTINPNTPALYTDDYIFLTEQSSDINVFFETTRDDWSSIRQKILNSKQLTTELVALIVEGVEQQ